MEPSIALPPRSAPEMVSQKSVPIPGSTTSSKIVTGDHSSSIRYSSTSSTTHRVAFEGHLSPAARRTRLDAATTNKLLSAVTPADSNIMGLGITFDDMPSSTISNMTIDSDSMHNSKCKAQNTGASNPLASAFKKSACTAVSPQDSRNGVSIAETGPPRWPSGVPGLGNTILGPRCSRMSYSSSSPLVPYHETPEHNHNTILSAHITASSYVPLAPPSGKPSRAIRTNTKRKATSPPSSTGLSAKVAKVSVDSINAQPSVLKRDQKDEQAPKRFGPRRLGPSETEKRAKAAKLWQAEQEKIDKEMERITREGVKTHPGETRSYVTRQHSVQNGSQLLRPDTVLEGHAGCQPLSPEVQKTIEYTCDTTGSSTQLSVEQGDEQHGGSYKGHKTSEIVRQSGRSEGRTTKLDLPRSHKQISQGSPRPDTSNTQRSRHPLPSAIKTPSSTSSNDKKRVSFTEPPHLTSLANNFLRLLVPYTHLHPCCSAVRPLQLIHSSISSVPLTAMALITAMKDVQELLKVLASHQLATLAKLEAMKEELQKVGMECVIWEARRRVQDTQGDVKRLGEWMEECRRFGDEI